MEYHLKFPEIDGFDKDVLMLVIDNSPYGMRVPLLIGTLHMALNAANNTKIRRLD